MEGLILTFIFLGLALAVLTPKKKLGTATSLLAFVGYFTLVGVENWISILLFIVGLLLIILEVFIPNFGFVGISGTLSIIFGLYWTLGDWTQTIQDLSIAIIATTVVIVYLVQRGYSLANVNKLVLHSIVPGTNTPSNTHTSDQLIQPGLQGIAQTPLRPSGKVTFENDSTYFDVISSEGHISCGTPIEVEKVFATKILVRRHRQHPAPPHRL